VLHIWTEEEPHHMSLNLLRAFSFPHLGISTVLITQPVSNENLDRLINSRRRGHRNVVAPTSLLNS